MHQPSFPLRSTFLAIPLQDEALAEFQRLQALLKPFEDCLTFQNPQTPHLTLMFWPEAGELEYQGIAGQAAKIAGKTPAFTLKVTGPDTFGERGRDSVLFFSIAFSPELALLKKSCPWTDRREFHPHITIARVYHPERFAVVKKEVLKRLAAEFAVPARRLRLYGNVHGEKQTPLKDFAFNA
ncbi:MAG TPA: 2'-5' RNA ligase family protein [Candidatus Peribacteria bacterium]|nr:2'-5' RNA ligase family protein [Candidatus Peribacteria bacterium]